MPKIMVVAGEVSGDMQAARVIKEIQKLYNTRSLEEGEEVVFFGMGGAEMRKAGVEILYDPTQISTIGFVEAIKHLRHFYQLLDMLTEVIDERKPDVLFLVDYSGFNMKMAKIGQKKGVPVVNYFSPSAWVWGKWRAKKMAQYEARIAAVFPMEVAVYEQAGANVTFVGHPLLDFVSPVLTEEEFRKKLGLSVEQPIIGLLPGSRRGEITSLLPPMLEAAQIIHRERPEFSYLLPIASPALKDLVVSILQNKGRGLPVKLVDGQAYEIMDSSEMILCASGTATLEAACLNVPMVIAYKTSWSTYRLGKLLVKVKYVGLPNIIAGTEIVPELLQKEVTGENLAKEGLKILNDSDYCGQMTQHLAAVRQALGSTGAVKRVAEMILDVLARRRK